MSWVRMDRTPQMRCGTVCVFETESAGVWNRRGLRLTMMAGGLVALVLCAPVAAAQSRTATIRASATIIGGPGSDVLAAEAVTPQGVAAAAGFAAGAGAGDALRITGRRGQQLSIQVESERSVVGAPSALVAICERAGSAAAETCHEHHMPTVGVTAGGRGTDVMVRVGAASGTRLRTVPAAPIRVTIAYITG